MSEPANKSRPGPSGKRSDEPGRAAQAGLHAPAPRAMVEVDSPSIVLGQGVASPEPTPPPPTPVPVPVAAAALPARELERYSAIRADKTIVASRKATEKLIEEASGRRRRSAMVIWVLAAGAAFVLGGVLATLSAGSAPEAPPSAPAPSAAPPVVAPAVAPTPTPPATEAPPAAGSAEEPAAAAPVAAPAPRPAPVAKPRPKRTTPDIPSGI